MIFADYLSRVCPTKGETIELEHTIHTIQISLNQLVKVKEVTSADPELSTLCEQIVAGWPDCPQIIPKNIRHYHSLKDYLSIEDGILFYGERMMVPNSLKQEYLERIHTGHLGITKSQARAKEAVFWKYMTKNITEYIGDCKECLTNSRGNSKEPMMSHQTATSPWQIIATDLFEFHGDTYVLVADQFRKMAFIRNLSRNTRSKKVICFLETLFGTYGTPHDPHV